MAVATQLAGYLAGSVALPAAGVRGIFWAAIAVIVFMLLPLAPSPGRGIQPLFRAWPPVPTRRDRSVANGSRSAWNARPTLPGALGRAFTLPQLLITVSLTLLLTHVLLPLADDPQGDVASVVQELNAWLDGVQRRSQMLAGQSCTVSFRHTNEEPLTAGMTLAEVSPASCAPTPARVPSASISQPRFQQKLLSGNVTLVFTPRGTVTASTDTELRIRRVDAAVIHCLKISAILGTISRGSRTDATPTATTSCPEQSYGSDLL